MGRVEGEGRRRRSRESWRFFLPRRATRLGLPAWVGGVGVGVGLDGALAAIVVGELPVEVVVGETPVVVGEAATLVVVTDGGSCTLTCGTPAPSFPKPETASEPGPGTISPCSVVVSLSLKYERSETELVPYS